MTKVFITDYISDPDTEKEILGPDLSEHISGDVKVLLVWHENINGEYLDQFPRLQGVVRYGVGFDAIDLDEIKKRGLVFCNTPDYGTDEVSDTALTMLLNMLRGVTVYDDLSRGYIDNWQENVIAELRRTSEMTLGIIGAGRIGTALILKAKALKINIIFFDPFKDSGYEKSLGVNRAYKLQELLEISDFISIHTPLTEQTRGMVNQSFVDNMKDGASLINTARGEIVEDLDILYKALISNKISNVALDVLPDEPPKACRFIDAWRNREPSLFRKIIINPHTSYYTLDAYNEMRIKASVNARRILDGEEPLNIIADGRSQQNKSV